jgi:hypothetical protein
MMVKNRPKYVVVWKMEISLYENLLYKNCCVDGFILSFIKLYTQQDACNKCYGMLAIVMFGNVNVYYFDTVRWDLDCCLVSYFNSLSSEFILFLVFCHTPC